ncbi:MAG: rRNA maturation RNase YbeY [Eubacteriales bacterium]|nr:rRNA maturation RNase YbeY [Eubacteriales bacterium]MDD4717652.1 rRNA maturation RNase YbeY [Eubacteriales bacterium]
MIIQIQNNQRKYKVSYLRDFLEKTGKTIEESIVYMTKLEPESIEPVISVLLTNDKNIRNLNSIFRGIDRATDVLSFPTLETNGRILKTPDKEDIISYPDGRKEIELGDIAISVYTVENHAAEIGNTFEEELRFVFIHSVLHLLGYDHIDKRDESIMIREQRRLIKLFEENTNE